MTDREVLKDGLELIVANAMAELTEQQCEIINMVVYERRSFSEIGSFYNISRQSAHRRYERAKAQLHKRLEKNQVIKELLNGQEG